MKFINRNPVVVHEAEPELVLLVPPPLRLVPHHGCRCHCFRCCYLLFLLSLLPAARMPLPATIAPSCYNDCHTGHAAAVKKSSPRFKQTYTLNLYFLLPRKNRTVNAFLFAKERDALLFACMVGMASGSLG